MLGSFGMQVAYREVFFDVWIAVPYSVINELDLLPERPCTDHCRPNR